MQVSIHFVKDCSYGPAYIIIMGSTCIHRSVDVLWGCLHELGCRASPFKRGARFHCNFISKTILLYMQTGLACLGGISLDSNGAPDQPGLNLSM